MPEAQVRETVEKLVRASFVDITARTTVNLLRLNLALDAPMNANR
jgi:K+-transporting ATPase c subunit